MQDYAVVYTPRARKKLFDIFDLIFDGYANYFAAVAMADKITKKCQSLATAPKASAVKVVINGKDYRFAHVKKYTIIYYIDEEGRKINIMSIEYSKRDIQAIVKKWSGA